MFEDLHSLTLSDKKYLLIAIDGSFGNVPEHDALKYEFGGTKFKKDMSPEELKTPQVHFSIAYLPCDEQILDFIMEPHDVSEIPMMMRHLKRLEPYLDKAVQEGITPVILADRYYPGVELFMYLRSKNYQYIIRAKSNFFKHERNAVPDDVLDFIISSDLTDVWLKRFEYDYIRMYAANNRDIQIRVIRSDYSLKVKKDGRKGPYEKTEEVHVEYFSSIPVEEMEKSQVIDHYHKDRWRVECGYRVLKNQLEIEMVNTQNPIGIRNQMFGKVIFFNIEKLIFREACRRMKSSGETQYIPNNKSLIHKILTNRSFLRALICGELTDSQVEWLLREIIRVKCRVVPGRHYQRWDKFKIAIPRRRYRLDGRNHPPLKLTKKGLFTCSPR